MCLAIPGKVRKIFKKDTIESTGNIDFGGIIKEVSLAFVPEARVGDYVYVHAGVAISRLSKKEAEKVLEILEGKFG